MESGVLVFGSSRPSLSSAGFAGNTPFLRGGGDKSLSIMDETAGGIKRRSFFSSPEELIFEDEYYDEKLVPEKKRRLTAAQVHLLEQSFVAENKLEPERKSEIANKLGLQPRQVAVWFQNRRARWKTKQLERNFDLLKSSYNSLLADHDSLIADNKLLCSEVLSLTEKLRANKSADGPKPELQRSLLQQAGLLAVLTQEGAQVTVEESGSFCTKLATGEHNGSFTGLLCSSEDNKRDDGGGYFAGVEFLETGDFVERYQHAEGVEGEMLRWWVHPLD